jgi:hypothetical protein
LIQYWGKWMMESDFWTRMKYTSTSFWGAAAQREDG